MAIELEFEGSLTERHQTTVPSGVRRALKVGARDRIVWRVVDGQSAVVTFRKEEPEELPEDPALTAFLDFLERDIARGNLVPVTKAFMDQVTELVHGVIVDLDAPLPIDDDDE